MSGGPDPHRSVTGSWGPGEDTGLVHHPQDPPTAPENHWPWAIPSALLIVAKLGSLAANEREVIWITERDGKPGDGFYFAARRSSGAGSQVRLMFGLSDGLPGAEDGPLVPWFGADHSYAWAQRATGAHPFGTGTVYASGRCSVVSQIYNGSGETGGMVDQTWGNTGIVPAAAKADAEVTYVASWWVYPSPVAPTADELGFRALEVTCGASWNIGRIGRAWQ